MPGGGAGTLDQLIALYIGWGREFVVLLDSDGEGERQKARYVDKFGLALTDRLFTLGDLVPSLVGKSLESVYQPVDRTNLVIALGGDPTHQVDKKTLNRMVQEALIRSTPLHLSNEAGAMFASLLSQLDDRMKAVAAVESRR